MGFTDFARELTPPFLWSAMRRAKRSLSTGNAKVVLRTVHGVELLLNETHALPAIVAQFPLYDTALPAFASFLLRRRNLPITVIDVGANIGDTARLIAAAVGRENVRFICIEADDLYIPLLVHNTAALNAEIVHAIAGRSSGVAELRPRPNGPGTSAIVSDATAERRLARIDDLTGDRVDIFKTDTEGFEVEVLTGAADTLERTDAVYLEFSPELLRQYGKCEPREVLDCIRSHGFAAALVYDNFGAPIGLFRDRALDVICNYVDVQRIVMLDLLFCRDESLLAEFAALEQQRARIGLRPETVGPELSC